MIPVLYEKDGVTKKSVLNDSLEAYVTEERNGDFELELTYPVSGDVYKSLDKEKIIMQFSKTNDTPFEFKNFDIELDDGLFLPVSVLNDL